MRSVRNSAIRATFVCAAALAVFWASASSAAARCGDPSPFGEPDDSPACAADPDGYGSSSAALGFGLDVAVPTVLSVGLLQLFVVDTAIASPREVSVPARVLAVAPKTSPPVRF